MKRGAEPLVGGPPKRPVQGAPAAAAGAARLTTNDALTYLRDVKNKFSDRKDVYDTFLEIMKEFKAQRIDTAGVIRRVKDLFRGHKELILGFNTFLPKGFEIQVHEVEDDEVAQTAAKQPVEFDQAISYVNKIKQRFASDERVYKAFLEILNMYRKGQKTINEVYAEVAVLFQSHRDLLKEFTHFLPDNSQQAAAPARPPARGGWGGGRGGGRGAMGRGYPQYGSYGPPGQYGGGGYGGKRRGGRPGEEQDYARQTALQRELVFFDKVKARLRSKESYQDLLKTLNMYASDIINRTELLNLARDILGHFPDLVAGFSQFLTRMEAFEGFEQDLKTIAAAGGRLNPRDIARLRTGAGRDRWMNKPVSEIASDMANEDKSDRCTDSYVHYPSCLPALTCSGRDALCREVLNDDWVSIVSGSEDYSFKLMRKNQYEEALFRCEDDRYELDMAIEQNAATMGALRPIIDALAALSPEDKAAYRLPDDTLHAVHFRAIERIYGEQSGTQVCDLLRKNPAVAIPVIMPRLEQKDAEWREVREEMNKSWRKVFDSNYAKSLDHRSFYFKQADKKALLTKAMAQEVKDAADARRARDDSLRSLAAGCPVAATLAADLSYDYADSSVFDDVYTVVAYAVEDMLSGEARSAVIRFWTRCVEPLFGLPERTYSQLHTKSEPEVHHDAPSSSSSDGGNGGPRGSTRNDGDATSAGATATGAGRSGRSGAAATPEPGTTPEPEEGTGGGGGRGGKRRGGGGAAGEDGSSGGAKSDADSQGSDDTTADRFYDTCRPVASRLNPEADGGAAAAAGAPVAARPDWARRRVLYGNDALYYFLRFHHHLYDRMLAARRCARDRNAPTSLFRQQTAEAREAANSAEAAAEAARLHAEFMGMVRQLIDGTLDPSTFEDQVRSLLGTNSYVLFTLDKLVYKLVKHMQLMVGDEQTMRLCELHRYEAARRAPLAEEVYRANAALVLPDDANCYRFELAQREAAAADDMGGFYRLATPAPAEAPGDGVKQEPAAAAALADGEQQRGKAVAAAEAVALTVQLVDPDRVEVHPAGLDPVFGDYMRGFMATPAAGGAVAAEEDGEAEARGGGGGDDEEGGAAAAANGGGGGRPREPLVFLPRQARAAGVMRAGAGRGGAFDEAALGRLLTGVALSNGLECKISCANSKVSYVLDTEDVMWRRGPRRFAQRRAEAAAAAAAAPEEGGGEAAGSEKPRQPPCPDPARAAHYTAWLAGREEALKEGFHAAAGSFPEPMAT